MKEKETIYFRPAGPELFEKLYNDFIIPYFPEDEVKPLAMIRVLYEKNEYEIYTLQLENEGKAEIVAAAFLAECNTTRRALLDYLAVDSLHRSRGLGSRILSELACLDRGILFETERLEDAETPEELSDRKRRNAFYLANGAKRSGVVTCAFGVPYDIWTLHCPGPMEKKQVEDDMAKLYHNMVGDSLYKKYVRIPYLIQAESEK